MEIGESVNHVRQNLQPCRTWEQQQADNDEKRRELASKSKFSTQQLKQAEQRGEVIINITNKLNQYSDNKVQDVDAGTGYVAMLSKIPFAIGAAMAAKLGYMPFRIGKKYTGKEAMVAGFLASFIPSIPMVLWRTDKQKEAAQVARFQARNQVLNDPRNFVIYTPEQIAKAKQIAKDMPDLKEDGVQEKFHKSLHSLIKDKKNYQNWKADNKLKEIERQNLYNKIQLTPEEIQQAKNDQDLIFRTVNKVDKKSKEYSFNTEMLSGLVLSSPILAASFIEKPLEKLGAFKNPIFKMPILGSKGPNLSTIISGMVAFAATLPISLSLRKNAAQIGRFKAKEELTSDPSNFISYTQEQLDSEKDIKASPVKTGFWNDIVNDIKFIPKSIRDTIEYKNYQKGQAKEDIKFQKALTEVPITKEQIKDAKKLQTKLFRTFDKMDDMSQRYSQDVEGAASLVECIIEELGIGVMAIGGALLSKVNIAKIKNNINKTIGDGIDKVPGKGKLNIPLPSVKLTDSQLSVLSGVKRITKMSLIVSGALGGVVSLHAGLAWIKKQAARVGIMKATQELADYRNFADKYDEQNTNQDRQINSDNPDVFKNFKMS